LALFKFGLSKPFIGYFLLFFFLSNLKNFLWAKVNSKVLGIFFLDTEEKLFA